MDRHSIFHLTSPERWADAGRTGVVTAPSLDDEGFVHCSTAAQLPATVERHFRPGDDLVVLVLDPERLTADLRWEASFQGQEFPHVYGPLPVDAVVEAVSWPGAPTSPRPVPEALARHLG